MLRPEGKSGRKRTLILKFSAKRRKLTIFQMLLILFWGNQTYFNQLFYSVGNSSKFPILLATVLPVLAQKENMKKRGTRRQEKMGKFFKMRMTRKSKSTALLAPKTFHRMWHIRTTLFSLFYFFAWVLLEG